RAGRIMSINRTVPGLRPEDVIGMKVSDFIPADGKQAVQDILERVFRDRKAISYETQAIGPNGTVSWYSTRVGPVQIGEQVVAATYIATDITERRQAEQRQQVQHAVTQVLAEAASLDEAIPRILQRVGSELDWPVGILWKVDPAANVLRQAEAW